MNRLMASCAAQQTSDLWSKLLGIDRVRTDGGEISIAWKHMPEAWVLFLLIIPAVLLVIYAFYRGERKDVGLGPKLVMTALRAALVVLVILMLFVPVLSVETLKVRKAYVIALLDDSRSMKKADPLHTREDKLKVGRATGVADEDDEISPSEDAEIRRLTRAEIVRKVLSNPRLRILEQLEEKLNVAYFTFSGGATPRESREKLIEGYRTENCLGTETAIGDAIKAAMNSLRGQNIAGVIVFSDGKNNAGMATLEIAKQLKQRYLPIYTVAAGIPHALKDIALLELEARDAILANDEMTLAFKLRGEGYENEPVTVGLWVYTIKDTDKDLSLKPEDLDRLIGESVKDTDHAAKLSAGGQKQAETITYSPKTPGDYLLILKVDPRAEENTAHNNYLAHRLRVADDKIKVLFVEHPPRWDYRYLKNALIRDPKILAHCLLTSADEGFSQEHTKSEHPLFREPLKEFPRDLKSLLEFDVVIYGNVDPGRLGPDAARNIEKFVSEFGGGVIFISGEVYNPRTLAGTPLADLLPVIADDSREPFDPDRIYSQEYGYHLTADGKTSPITTYKEFRGDKEKNLERWEDRDERGDGQIRIRWFQRIRKLKAGATALVEVAGVQGEATRPPLFVTQHVGRGRVFWSGTDESYLWRKSVGDYPWFYPFWQQSMYWVRQGKLLGARRYRVSVDKERYSRGEPVQIFANAYDDKFEPKQDPAIEVFVDPPAGDRVKVTLNKDKNRDGYYEGEYRPGDTGAYRVWAGEEDEATRASAPFTVFIPDREEEEPILDIPALKELAAGSHLGRFFPIDQVHELNTAIQKSENMLREVKEDDLWDSPLVYLLFALLITAEWILRKIFRML